MVTDFVVRKHALNNTISFHEDINEKDVYKYLTYQFDSKRTKCTTSYDLCFPKIEKQYSNLSVLEFCLVLIQTEFEYGEICGNLESTKRVDFTDPKIYKRNYR